MKHLLAIVLILALFVPANKPACVVRYTNSGRAVCWCKADRAGSTWKTAPMAACKIWR